MKIAIIDEENAMLDILNIDKQAMETAVEQWCSDNNEEYCEDDVETYLQEVLGYRLNHVTWMEVGEVRELDCKGKETKRVDNDCEILYSTARRKEEAEFRDKVKMLYESGKFEYKPIFVKGAHYAKSDSWEYALEMEEESRPVLLANFDEGPDDVRIGKIVVHGAKFEDGWIELEGESSRNYGCEYAFGIDDLEHGHLSYLTCEL